MAYTIDIDKDSIGLETVTQNGARSERFHALCTVKKDGVPVCKRLVQACADAADLTAKCEALLAEFKEVGPTPDPQVVSETERIATIKASITKTTVQAKAVEPK